jgi:uncharacterized delta-60 repeat protein
MPVKNRPPNRITAAPALGLWSQTFVRLHGGQLVAVGFSRLPEGVALVRYLGDGSVDRAFPRRVWPQFGAGELDALAATGQRDDKIVVAACQPPECWGYFVVARFLPDGRLDPTFGQGGIVRATVPNAASTPRAVALQPDGKVVVAGELQRGAPPGVRDSFVARFHPDGRLDAEFGANGIVVLGYQAHVRAVVVHADGRVLVGGDPVVARLTPRGELDPTFGAGGVVGNPPLSVEALLLQPGGKIVAAGWDGTRRPPIFALARFTAAGKLDRSFARRGRLLHTRPGDHWARVETLLPMAGRRLVAVGWATRGPTVLKRRYRVVVLVLTPSGRLDPSFRDGGRFTLTSVEAQGRAAFSVAPRSLLVIGPDDDLEPKKVVFSRVLLR